MPGIAGLTLLSRVPSAIFAQGAAGSVDFSQASASVTSASPAVASGLQTALGSCGTAQERGMMTSSDVNVLSSAYNTWVGNVAETNYFANLDAVLNSNPAAFLTDPIPFANVAQSIQIAQSLGFQTPSAQSSLSSLQQYRATLTTNDVLAMGSAGSKSLFVQTGSALTKIFANQVAVRPIAFYSHSTTCNVFFAGAIAAGLTGFEIAAACFAIASYMSDC